MKKVGIITFHNSYNCGSMLETYALQYYLRSKDLPVEIVHFSNEGQQNLYRVFEKNTSLKKVIKNFICIFYRKKLFNNNNKYHEFQKKYFPLSKFHEDAKELTDKDYQIVIAGSDQIWNITIADFDDAYFLPWVKCAYKVAYAPSFGAKNIMKYAKDYKKYQTYLNDFDALSIREYNGQKWIKDLTGKEVEVLIDPTLLLDAKEYDKLLASDINIPENYIFFYCPTFDKEICKYVAKIAKKYHLPVIAWSAKNYYVHFIKRFHFQLPEYENPSAYLTLIKNATMVFTTSFHGTIFSALYHKAFWTIKNGGMYGDDDRVISLLTSIDMMDRLIPYQFDDQFDYLQAFDYEKFQRKLTPLRKKAKSYIKKNMEEIYERSK